jgi:tetratricopeptide (TPR) repeat protein
MNRIEQIKEMLVTNPGDSFLQHALALEFIKIEEDEKARELFQNLLQENENYVGSYYHLGKLLERNDKINDAKEVYERGMLKAKECGDMHTYNELRTAYEDLIF